MNPKLLFAAIVVLVLTTSAEAQILWSSRYGVSGGQDSAMGITLTSDNNIAITGIRNQTGSNSDIYTIKYDQATGDTLWVRFFGGTSNSNDIPSFITSDANAVYVTGWVFNLVTGRDMIILKYNSATGNLEWSKQYNGPVNGGEYSFSCAVDGNGNVYITGRSDVGGAQKITTIKYNSSGDVQWTAIYSPGAGLGSFDEGRAIKVDANGNVYVGGYGRRTSAEDSWDFITIKYNSSGTEQWDKRYNGNFDKADYLVGLELDQNNDVIVSGSSFRIANDFDFVTIKYSGSTGDSLGGAIYGSGGLDIVTSMTIDASGNTYITGYSQGISTNADFATVKYGPNLQQLWASRYTGTEGVNFPQSIIVNANGVYVSGTSYASGNYDFMTIRYSSDGEQLAILPHNITGGNDYVSDIVSDPSGNIYVTGSANFGSPSGTDMYTEKYIWTLSSIKKINDIIPKTYTLYQNFPNPFNPVTNIKFDIIRKSDVKVVIFDVLGNEVKVVADDKFDAGSYIIDFDASGLSSGVYFYRLITPDFSQTKKMILTK